MNKQEILEKVDQVDDLLEEAMEEALKSCLAQPYTQSEVYYDTNVRNAIRYDPTINLIYRSQRILGHLLDEIE